MTTTTADLLAALGAHLAAFELPLIASVVVRAEMPAPQLTVQLTGEEPSAIAQGLLAWADTLTDVTAETWRVPRSDSVHLSVTGLLPGGATVYVYGGLRVTDCCPGAGLEPNATTTLPLLALRHLATPEQVTL
ncbi:MAG: hypothetical protein ACRDTA_12100 [Pseudonocardiaceae bacterium]